MRHTTGFVVVGHRLVAEGISHADLTAGGIVRPGQTILVVGLYRIHACCHQRRSLAQQAAGDFAESVVAAGQRTRFRGARGSRFLHQAAGRVVLIAGDGTVLPSPGTGTTQAIEGHGRALAAAEHRRPDGREGRGRGDRRGVGGGVTDALQRIRRLVEHRLGHEALFIDAADLTAGVVVVVPGAQRTAGARAQLCQRARLALCRRRQRRIADHLLQLARRVVDVLAQVALAIELAQQATFAIVERARDAVIGLHTHQQATAVIAVGRHRTDGVGRAAAPARAVVGMAEDAVFSRFQRWTDLANQGLGDHATCVPARGIRRVGIPPLLGQLTRAVVDVLDHRARAIDTGADTTGFIVEGVGPYPGRVLGHG